MESNQEANETQQNGTQATVSASIQTEYLTKSYEKSPPRVSKDTLYMIIALWIEDFVDDNKVENYRYNAGAMEISQQQPDGCCKNNASYPQTLSLSEIMANKYVDCSVPLACEPWQVYGYPDVNEYQ